MLQNSCLCNDITIYMEVVYIVGWKKAFEDFSMENWICKPKGYLVNEGK